MPLERLRVENVRCLSSVELVLGARQNFVFGPNGAGKTSLLESMFMLGRGRSFRTRQTGRLLKKGTSRLSVFGEVREGQAVRRIGIAFSAGNLEVRIDGGNEQSLVELARTFPVHVIDPRAHDLIEAGPSERRRFLDAGVFHVEQAYLDAWRGFRRALGQRNAALKQGASGQLGIWDGVFLQSAEEVHAARERYVQALGAAFAGIGQRLLGRAVTLEYEAGWRRGERLEAALRDSRGRDLKHGFTQVGPHRADLGIRLGTSTARDTASRGQQKLIAAALVIAQVGTFAASSGYGGLLLVDDPAAELDPQALGLLRSELERVEAQLVMTGISEQALAPGPGHPVFHVEQGEIRAVL